MGIYLGINSNHLKLAFLFLISYAALYFLGSFSSVLGLPLHNWQLPKDLTMIDYMYMLFPVVGFFGVYMLIDWIDQYYKTRFAHSPLFPAAFFLLGMAAYYVAIYWYNANIAQLAGMDKVEFDFIALFLDSVMLPFLLAGVLGWASKIAMERISAQQQGISKPSTKAAAKSAAGA